MGFPHPDYLYEHLTAKQMAEWQAYYNIEPFGQRHSDHSAGLATKILSEVIIDASKPVKRPSKPFELSNFVIGVKADKIMAKITKIKPDALKQFFLDHFDVKRKKDNG